MSLCVKLAGHSARLPARSIALFPRGPPLHSSPRLAARKRERESLPLVIGQFLKEAFTSRPLARAPKRDEPMNGHVRDERRGGKIRGRLTKCGICKDMWRARAPASTRVFGLPSLSLCPSNCCKVAPEQDTGAKGKGLFQSRLDILSPLSGRTVSVTGPAPHQLPMVPGEGTLSQGGSEVAGVGMFVRPLQGSFCSIRNANRERDGQVCSQVGNGIEPSGTRGTLGLTLSALGTGCHGRRHDTTRMTQGAYRTVC